MTFHDFKLAYQKIDFEVVNPQLKGTSPLVSICIQTYQQKDYISACLESVLNQKTNFAFEILLGEDGSEDGTRELCLEYAFQYPEKITLFLHNRQNQIKILQEPTSNFNALYNFFSARGKYMAFCEGDDFWADPYSLQKQINFLEKNENYIFSYHSFSVIDQYGIEIDDPLNHLQPMRDLSSLELQKVQYHPLLLCTCFRNKIKDIPYEMAEVINVDTFLFSLLGKFGDAKFQDEIEPAKYRKHNGGIWSKRKRQKKFLSKIITFKKIRDYYRRGGNKNLAQYYNKKLGKAYKMLVYDLLRNGYLFSALKLLTGNKK